MAGRDPNDNFACIPSRNLINTHTRECKPLLLLLFFISRFLTLEQRERNGEEREREEERGSWEKQEEKKDTKWLLHNEPAATRGNRNNYAKTERNGASRAKAKRSTLWDEAKGASRNEMVVEMACKGGLGHR